MHSDLECQQADGASSHVPCIQGQPQLRFRKAKILATTLSVLLRRSLSSLSCFCHLQAVIPAKLPSFSEPQSPIHFENPQPSGTRKSMQMGWLIALSLWGCTLLLGEPDMTTRLRAKRAKLATGSAGPAARPRDQQAEVGRREAFLRLPRWGAGYPSFARAGTTWETPRMSCLRSGSTARTSAHSWPPSSRSEAHPSPAPHSPEAPGSGWAADAPEKCFHSPEI